MKKVLLTIVLLLSGFIWFQTPLNGVCVLCDNIGNDGYCVADRNGNMNCKCVSPYGGPRCNTIIDHVNECQHMAGIT